MRVLSSVVLAGLLSFAAPTFADTVSPPVERQSRAELIAGLRDMASIHDARANEWSKMAEYDLGVAASLRQHAEHLKVQAQKLSDKAVELRANAQFADAQGARELNKLADDLDVFATHDRGVASWRTEKAKEFETQANSATTAAQDHRNAAARCRASLARLGG